MVTHFYPVQLSSQVFDSCSYVVTSKHRCIGYMVACNKNTISNLPLSAEYMEFHSYIPAVDAVA